MAHSFHSVHSAHSFQSAHSVHSQYMNMENIVRENSQIQYELMSQNMSHDVSSFVVNHIPPPLREVRTREHFLTVLGRHICPLSRYEEAWEQYICDLRNDEGGVSPYNDVNVDVDVDVFTIEAQRKPVVREIGRILGFFRMTWESHEDLRDIVEPIYMNYVEHRNITPLEADILEELAEEYIPQEYCIGREEDRERDGERNDERDGEGEGSGEGEDEGEEREEPADIAVREE
jgi:hypothetical protein